MITRFRVQNFKSIRDVTVELAPVTVLVGKSGTGKSNFVEAIRCLRDALRGGQQAQELAQQWALVRPAANRSRLPNRAGRGQQYGASIVVIDTNSACPPKAPCTR